MIHRGWLKLRGPIGPEWIDSEATNEWHKFQPRWIDRSARAPGERRVLFSGFRLAQLETRGRGLLLDGVDGALRGARPQPNRIAAEAVAPQRSIVALQSLDLSTSIAITISNLFPRMGNTRTSRWSYWLRELFLEHLKKWIVEILIRLLPAWTKEWNSLKLELILVLVINENRWTKRSVQVLRFQDG